MDRPTRVPPVERVAPSVTASASPSPPASEVTASPPSPPEKAPRTVGERSTALAVDGYLPAVLISPDVDARPRPLLVVTHGAGDRPEPACAHYDELAAHQAFVLCVRGRATNKHLPEPERGYFYDGHFELEKELVAARDALSRSHPGEVVSGGVLFAGFSQGASMGVLALEHGAAEELGVTGLLLVEGGASQWNVAAAEKLGRAGVRRVALVCGTLRCLDDAKVSARWIERGGVEARVLYGAYAGHTLEGTMRGPVEEAFRWLAPRGEGIGSPASSDASPRTPGVGSPSIVLTARDLTR